ncbi:hypothetical protein [Terrilactibacillus laevilacticus]|uniref:hypothetical protein n=1 Tax=Terrilactibacillus laevilacticus TaxID=1380157 RepID=UPI00114796EE|nr:hypothetical protein [Terrilactibacillus laevilacticus]
MKQLTILCFLTLFPLLSGCSDSGYLASKAEDLGNSIDYLMGSMHSLEKQESLSSSDQRKIVKDIDQVHRSISSFKDVNAPWILKKTKKYANEKLTTKDKKLVKIREKAERGEATIKDVRKVIDEMEDDFDLKLFNKK